MRKTSPVFFNVTQTPSFSHFSLLFLENRKEYSGILCYPGLFYCFLTYVLVYLQELLLEAHLPVLCLVHNRYFTGAPWLH
jgi:hypothetical protein